MILIIAVAPDCWDWFWKIMYSWGHLLGSKSQMTWDPLTGVKEQMLPSIKYICSGDFSWAWVWSHLWSFQSLKEERNQSLSWHILPKVECSSSNQVLSQNLTEGFWIPTQQLCVMEMLSKQLAYRRVNSKTFPKSVAHNISMMLCGG